MAGADYRGWTSRDDFLKGQPSLTFQESFPRDEVSTDLVASISSGVMTAVALPLIQGDAVTNLGFLSGATALATPTHAWAALYDTGGNLLAQSTDQPALAWAADTYTSLALQSTVQIALTGVYFAGIMVAATTVPTLMGKTTGRAAAAGGAFLSGLTPLARTSGSALTTTAPATIASPTAVATIPYCVAQDTRS